MLALYASVQFYMAPFIWSIKWLATCFLFFLLKVQWCEMNCSFERVHPSLISFSRLQDSRRANEPRLKICDEPGLIAETARKWLTYCLHRPRVGRLWRGLNFLENTPFPLVLAAWRRGKLSQEIPLVRGRADFGFPRTCANNDWKRWNCQSEKFTNPYSAI